MTIIHHINRLKEDSIMKVINSDTLIATNLGYSNLL